MKRNAFTLAELRVVIAIIAILAAILFPVYAQAKEAAVLRNEKQLAIDQQMYIIDTGDVLPAYFVFGDGTFQRTEIVSCRSCSTRTSRTAFRFGIRGAPLRPTRDTFRQPACSLIPVGAKASGPQPPTSQIATQGVRFRQLAGGAEKSGNQ